MYICYYGCNEKWRKCVTSKDMFYAIRETVKKHPDTIYAIMDNFDFREIPKMYVRIATCEKLREKDIINYLETQPQRWDKVRYYFLNKKPKFLGFLYQ